MTAKPVTAEPTVTVEPTVAAKPPAAKPTVTALGVDLAAQAWRRSGHGDGAIEVAFAQAGAAGPADHPDAAEWILMRVAGDPDQRVLVFDRHEWECFLDGARNGEFDAAAAPNP